MEFVGYHGREDPDHADNIIKIWNDNRQLPPAARPDCFERATLDSSWNGKDTFYFYFEKSDAKERAGKSGKTVRMQTVDIPYEYPQIVEFVCRDDTTKNERLFADNPSLSSHEEELIQQSMALFDAAERMCDENLILPDGKATAPERTCVISNYLWDHCSEIKFMIGCYSVQNRHTQLASHSHRPRWQFAFRDNALIADVDYA
ncbi:MAG: hypothetical protein LBC78_04025 [Oscillospiraceae bacterium]|jgi:hypothetical protein|nr:hypothetical protein [Oscillospiraceae bacterium]